MNFSAIQEQLAGWNQRLKELSMRERLLVCMTPILAVFGLGWNLLSHQLQLTTQKQQQLEQTLHQHQQLQSQIALLNTLASQAVPDDPEMLRLQAALTQRQNRIIEPQQLLPVLRLLLRQCPKVQLLHLQTAAAEKISLPEQPLLYRLPIQLQLRGSYFDVITCLTALENQGSFYWTALQDRIELYPANQFSVQLYLLGRNEVYLGS